LKGKEAKLNSNSISWTRESRRIEIEAVGRNEMEEEAIAVSCSN